MTHRNTIQLARAFESYIRSTHDSIYSCYKKCSPEKEQAFDRCKRLYFAVKGDNLRVIGYNSFSFSVGFLFTHPQSKKKAFCYITPNYQRFIYLDEIEQREGNK